MKVVLALNIYLHFQSCFINYMRWTLQAQHFNAEQWKEAERIIFHYFKLKSNSRTQVVVFPSRSLTRALPQHFGCSGHSQREWPQPGNGRRLLHASAFRRSLVVSKTNKFSFGMIALLRCYWCCLVVLFHEFSEIFILKCSPIF